MSIREKRIVTIRLFKDQVDFINKNNLKANGLIRQLLDLHLFNAAGEDNNFLLRQIEIKKNEVNLIELEAEKKKKELAYYISQFEESNRINLARKQEEEQIKLNKLVRMKGEFSSHVKLVFENYKEDKLRLLAMTSKANPKAFISENNILSYLISFYKKRYEHILSDEEMNQIIKEMYSLYKSEAETLDLLEGM